MLTQRRKREKKKKKVDGVKIDDEICDDKISINHSHRRSMAVQEGQASHSQIGHVNIDTHGRVLGVSTFPIEPQQVNVQLSDYESMNKTDSPTLTTFNDVHRVSYSYSSSSGSESKRNPEHSSSRTKLRTKMKKMAERSDLQQIMKMSSEQLSRLSKPQQQRYIAHHKAFYQQFVTEAQIDEVVRKRGDSTGNCFILSHVSSFLSNLFPPRGSAVVGVAPPESAVTFPRAGNTERVSVQRQVAVAEHTNADSTSSKRISKQKKCNSSRKNKLPDAVAIAS